MYVTSKEQSDVATQMMADLGLARRETLAAPEADSRGRVMREDPHRVGMIAQEQQARRDRLDQAVWDDEHANMCKSWYSK
jgi:hypothetical protein